MGWPSYPKILLADRDTRENLFSLTQESIFTSKPKEVCSLCSVDDSSSTRRTVFAVENFRTRPSAGHVLASLKQTRGLVKSERNATAPTSIVTGDQLPLPMVYGGTSKHPQQRPRASFEVCVHVCNPLCPVTVRQVKFIWAMDDCCR